MEGGSCVVCAIGKCEECAGRRCGGEVCEECEGGV